MRSKIAAGNWKMNGTAAALAELSALADMLPKETAEVIICPPAPFLFCAVEQTSSTPIRIGAQDCHTDPKGAYTGDVSAAMIADSGAEYVIVGHSERRDGHAETNEHISQKAQQAWNAGLRAIICVGESAAQREASETLNVIGAQIAGSVPNGADAANTIIAYEPIWAIGTGLVPTIAQITEVHDFIRSQLSERFGPAIAEQLSLLYGGSVKADNAAAIFEIDNVDGALVGGASLKASDFAPIVQALGAS